MNYFQNPLTSDAFTGADWVPRTPSTGWIAVQINLSEQSSGLHRLFGLQLLLNRKSIEGETPAKPGAPFPLQVCDRKLRIQHLPCCLSALVVLGERFEIDHYARPLEVNANCLLEIDADTARQLEVESSKLWLIRGKLLSGSFRFTDPTPAVRQSPDLVARLWPRESDMLTGIFMSGGQFQIEVLPPTPSNGLEAPGDAKRRRLQFQSATRDVDNRITGAIWRQVAVHDPDVEKPDATLRNHLATIGAIASRRGIGVVATNEDLTLVAHVGGAADEVSKWTVREMIRPAIRLVFSSETVSGEASVTEWTPRALLIEDGQKFVLVDQDEVAHLLNTGTRMSLPDEKDVSARVEWAPVHAVTTVVSSGSAGIGTVLAATQSQPKLDFIRPVALAATRTPGAAAEPAKPAEVWHIAAPIASGASALSWQNLPPSWVRYRIAPPPLLPHDGETDVPRVPSLSAPFSFPVPDSEGNPWHLEIELDRVAAEKIPMRSPVRIVCRLSEHDGLRIDFYGADLSLFSPTMSVYVRELTDARSVPNERDLAPDNPKSWAERRLVFRSDLLSEQRANLASGGHATPAEGSIFVTWINTTEVFRIHALRDALMVCLPARRALVDPVSLTRGNLVAEQKIHTRMLTQNVTVVKDATQILTGTHVVLDSFPGLEDKHVGLYGRWTEKEGGDPFLARIASIGIFREGGIEGIAMVLEGTAAIGKLKNKSTWNVMVGPTRLVVPRDPNHGLVGVQVQEVRWTAVSSVNIPVLHFDADTIRMTEISSVLALHPWSEWGNHPDRPLETGRVRLHHRNLVQEHAEFASSFEDRFPPEGPVDPVTGKSISPLLPFGDFIRAVRDRYTDASGNLVLDSAVSYDLRAEAARIQNWLPGCTVETVDGKQVRPRLVFTETPTNSFPETSIQWLGEHDTSVLNPGVQKLRIAIPGAPADVNWLEYDAEVVSLEVNSDTAPRVRLQDPTKARGPQTRRLVNSAAPLLFDAIEMSAVAVAVDSAQRTTAVIGLPGKPAHAWFAHDPGRLVEIPCGTVGAIAAGLLSLSDRTAGFIIAADRLRAHTFEISFEGIPSDAGPEISGAPLAGDPGTFTTIHSVCLTHDGDNPAFAAAFSSSGDTWVNFYRRAGAGWTSVRWQLPAGETSQVTAVALDTVVRAGTQTFHALVGFESGTVYHAEFASTGTPTFAQPLPVPKERCPQARSLALLITGETSGDEVVTVAVARQFAPEEIKRSLSPSEVEIFTRRAAGPWSRATIEQPTADFSLELVPVADTHGAAGCSLVVAAKDGLLQRYDLHSAAVTAPVRVAWARGAITSFAASRPAFEHRTGVSVQPPVLTGGTNVIQLFIADAADLTLREASSVEARAMDSLGVVRILPSEFFPASTASSGPAAGHWRIERLHVPVRPRLVGDTPNHLLLSSVSVQQFPLVCSDAPQSGDFTNYSDIQFSCEALKLLEDGTLPDEAQESPPYDPGRYGFYSLVGAANPGMELLSSWPRLYGMPIYVTRLLTLELSGEALSAIQFQAILVNPDDVASGLEAPGDLLDVPSLVRREVARGSLITIKVTPDSTGGAPPVEIIGGQSKIRWHYGVDRQVQIPDPYRGFSARLAEVGGKAAVETVDNKPTIVVTTTPADSRALVFGRLWPLIDSFELVGTGHFTKVGDAVVQTKFLYAEKRDPRGRVVPERLVTDSHIPVLTLASDKSLLRARAGDDRLAPLAGLALVWDEAGLREYYSATGFLEPLRLESQSEPKKALDSGALITMLSTRSSFADAQAPVTFAAVGVSAENTTVPAPPENSAASAHRVELWSRGWKLVKTWDLSGGTGGRTLVDLVPPLPASGEIADIEGDRIISPDHGLVLGEELYINTSKISSFSEERFRLIDVEPDSFRLALPAAAAPPTHPALTVSRVDTGAVYLAPNGWSIELPSGWEAEQNVELISRIAGLDTHLALVLGSTPVAGHYLLLRGGQKWSGTGTLKTAAGSTLMITGVRETLPPRVTSPSHGLATGNTVEITGTDIVDSPPGGWTVQVVSADEVVLKGDHGPVPEQDSAIPVRRLLPVSEISTRPEWGNSPILHLPLDECMTGDWLRVYNVDAALNGFARRVVRRAENLIQIFRHSGAIGFSGPVAWRRIRPISSITGSLLVTVHFDAEQGPGEGEEVSLLGISGADFLNRNWHAFQCGQPNSFGLHLAVASSGPYTAGTGDWRVAGTPAHAGTITGATEETPVLVTTNQPHGLVSGAEVHIENVQGNTAANGIWRVVITGPHSFNIYKPVRADGDAKGGYWGRVVETFAATLADGSPPVLSGLKESVSTGEYIQIHQPTTLANFPYFVFLTAADSAELWEGLTVTVGYKGGGAVTRLQRAPNGVTAPHSTITTLERNGLRDGYRVILEQGDGSLLRSILGTALDARVYTTLVLNTRQAELLTQVSLPAEVSDQWTTRSGAQWVAIESDSAAAALHSGRVELNSPPEKGSVPGATRLLLAARLHWRPVAITALDSKIEVWNIAGPLTDEAPLVSIQSDDPCSLSAVNTLDGTLLIASSHASAGAGEPATRSIRVHAIDPSLEESAVPVAQFDSPFQQSRVLSSLSRDEDRIYLLIAASQEQADGADLDVLAYDLNDLMANPAPAPVLRFKNNAPAGGALTSLHAQSAPAGLRVLAGYRDSNLNHAVRAWTPDSTFNSSSLPGAVVRCSTGIALRPDIGDKFLLSARMTRAWQVEARVAPIAAAEASSASAKMHAFAHLKQGPFWCFVVDPTVATAERGRGALLVWTEGDLLPGSPLAPDQRFGAAYMWEDYLPDQTLALAPSTTAAFRGPLLELNVLSSRVILSRSTGGDSLTPAVSFSSGWVHYRAESRVLFASMEGGAGRLVLLLEGHQVFNSAQLDAGTLSGVMLLQDAAGATWIQAPVRFSITGLSEATPTLALIGDASWLEQIQPRVANASPQPEIVFPALLGANGAIGTEHAFQVHDSIAVPGDDDTFVQLAMHSGSQPLTIKLQLRKLLPSAIPIDRELEPAVMRRVPRQGREAIQLIHRNGAGTRMRYDLDIQQFEAVVASQHGVLQRLEERDPAGARWALRPAVRHGKRVVLLEESGWITSLPSGVFSDLVTETLLTVFRPRSVPDSLAPAATAGSMGGVLVTAIESDTTDASTGKRTTQARNDESRYRKLLLKSGAAGVAVIRRLGSDGGSDFRFVNSPYFARVVDETDIPALQETLVKEALVQDAAAAGPPPLGIDNRAFAPAEARRWTAPLVDHMYRPTDCADDPFSADGCVPHRALRWQRRVSDADGHPRRTSFESDGLDRLPTLKLLEATAFREAAFQAHLSSRGRRGGRSNRQKAFLPGTVDVRLAADKPGSVFHHVLQASTSASSGPHWRWQVEPPVDFAMREPQQIKVGGCVTGQIKITHADVVAAVVGAGRLATLTAVWDEITGRVVVDEGLAGPGDEKQGTVTSGGWIKVGAGGDLRLNKAPVQLIVQFNDEVLPLLSSDPTVPAYELEYRGNGGGEQKFRHPARLFAVSSLLDPPVGAHRTLVPEVDGKVLAGELTLVDEDLLAVIFVASGQHLLPGSIIDLHGGPAADTPETEVNCADWRLFTNPDRAGTFILARDSIGRTSLTNVSGDWTASQGRTGKFSNTVGSSPVRAKLALEADPNNLTLRDGDIITIAGSTVLDGTWLVWSDGGEEHFLFQPGQSHARYVGKTAQWAAVTTRVAPYFQMSAVRENLTIEVSSEANHPPFLNGGGYMTGDYVRLKTEMTPELDGDWRLFSYPEPAAATANLHLHRLSFGNGTPAGAAGYIRIGGRAQVNIDSASNSAPIVIDLPVGTDAKTGDLADVWGVEGNTAANGLNWRILVRPENPRQIELYRDGPGPFIASSPLTTEAVLITPLGNAFSRALKSDNKTAALYEFDRGTLLRWKQNDLAERPLLQVMWAGRVDMPGTKPVFLKTLLAKLYDPIKQVKFLTPSQLSPKLGMIVTIPSDSGDTYAVHRNVLFGDAAPDLDATGRLVLLSKQQKQETVFEFLTTENKETVSFGLPPQIQKSAKLFLVKYLVTGAVIYDQDETDITETTLSSTALTTPGELHDGK